MELIHKNCEHCGTSFESKRKDKRYCSPRCKSEAWEKTGGKKPLGEPFDITDHQSAPGQQPLFPSIVKPERKVPAHLESSSAQFIIDTLKEDKQDLKDEVKKLITKLEQVTKERNDFEKELEKSRGALNAKPSALEGFASSFTAEHLLGLIKEAPAAFKAIREELKSQEKPVAGLPEAQQPREQDALAIWLGAQPPDVQTLFISMVKKIMAYKNTSMLKGVLNQLLQQTMRAA